MADDVDTTNERLQNESAIVIAEACRRAASIQTGEPGDCEYCGEWFARVVFVKSVDKFSCGRCRDLRKLE